jgi:hypothetical protein
MRTRLVELQSNDTLPSLLVPTLQLGQMGTVNGMVPPTLPLGQLRLKRMERDHEGLEDNVSCYPDAVS